jgi:hypothetical protein
MDKRRLCTRRQLLKTAGLVLGASALASLERWLGAPIAVAQDPAPAHACYFPMISVAPPPASVVHVHNLGATTWNGQADYWNQVNQNVVNPMVDAGLQNLTATPTIQDAWRKILPNYVAGQGIAIKVNFNNSGNGRLDAIIQTVNALVRGMKTIGVREQDIWVYDAIKVLPDRFIKGCLYPGVLFYDDGTHRAAGFTSNAPNAYIRFSPPSGVPTPAATKLNDVLIRATYLIDIPILKGHLGGAEVTLGFKNHFGSTNNPAAFHNNAFPSQEYWTTSWNPLVDLFANPHIRNKTVLVVGDGLFAGNYWSSAPLLLATFGNKTPNSLFFATDPVAIDSVMHDFVAAEWTIKSGANNYLRLANLAGFGVFERGNPWGSGYTRINYRKVEL